MASFFNGISQTQSDILQEIFFMQLCKLEGQPPWGFLWQLHDSLPFASPFFHIHLFRTSFTRFRNTHTHIATAQRYYNKEFKETSIGFQIKTVLI